MFATPAHLPKLVPWVDWAEWTECKAGLFHDSAIATQEGDEHGAARPLPLSFSSPPLPRTSVHLIHLQRALNIIAVWRARGRLPLSVDCTAQLLTVQRDDAAGAVDATSLRQQYALCIIRLVNGLVDSSQRSTHALSVASLASSLQLPRLLVDVRHESTHSQLPSLPVLRYAAWEALRWLWTHYWQQQDDGTDAITASIKRALHVWQYSEQTPVEEERVRAAMKELFATPAASAYLSTVLVSTLFPASSVRCLRPPSAASFSLSLPTDAAADVHFSSLLSEWQPLLSAVGKRLRELRVEALRHTVTQLVATAKQRSAQPSDDTAAQRSEDDDGRQWRVQLLSRWSLHFIQSLSSREGTISLYTNLASLCLLDTTDSCYAVLQALVGRLLAIDGQSDIEWAAVLDGQPAADTEQQQQQRRKRKKPTEQPRTSEWMHDTTTLDAMQAMAADEQQPRFVAGKTEAAGGSVGSSVSVSDIEVCEEWVACPIGVLPHQSSPQLSAGSRDEAETVDTQLTDLSAESRTALPSTVGSIETLSHEFDEQQQGSASSRQTAPSVTFCASGWDVPETELVALRPWQAAIAALPRLHMASGAG